MVLLPPGDKVNYTLNYLITFICANRPPFLSCLQIPSCPINYVSITPSNANLVRNFASNHGPLLLALPLLMVVSVNSKVSALQRVTFCP